ncbi:MULTISPECIES: Gfo/Idh/MocA family protein [Paraburkholderia]|uniref:Gfo/Idh/MocA family protein n=1 Tax=Paraburkholderia TaxID=1822464 RepID=UPI003218BE46
MSVAVGVIGAGVMGSEHARILREDVNGAMLVAVCDADEERASAAVGRGEVFSDPTALIRSDRVEAVLIAAPDAMHGDLVLKCIEAGKPVLCEKPLAATAAGALRVVEAEVKTAKRLVQVGYMRRFDPPYEGMKRLLSEGGIGKPHILHNIHRNAVAPGWFNGPMSITNAFVHEIDVCRWLLGSEPVTAEVRSIGGGDPLVITLETNRGEIVSTEVFMNCQYGYHVHAQLVGSTATVETVQPVLTRRNAAEQSITSYPINWIDRFREAYVRQMKAWTNSIATGQPNQGANAWDGYVTTKIAGEIVAAMNAEKVAQLEIQARPAIYA